MSQVFLCFCREKLLQAQKDVFCCLGQGTRMCTDYLKMWPWDEGPCLLYVPRNPCFPISIVWTGRQKGFYQMCQCLRCSDMTYLLLLSLAWLLFVMFLVFKCENCLFLFIRYDRCSLSTETLAAAALASMNPCKRGPKLHDERLKINAAI